MSNFQSVTEFKKLNKEKGFHFFSAEANRFFGSRVEPEMISGEFFLTSERDHYREDNPRCWTVRRARLDGQVDTIGDFQAHSTKQAALIWLAEYLRDGGE